MTPNIRALTITGGALLAAAAIAYLVWGPRAVAVIVACIGIAAAVAAIFTNPTLEEKAR